MYCADTTGMPPLRRRSERYSREAAAEQSAADMNQSNKAADAKMQSQAKAQRDKQMMESRKRPVLRLFPPCALVSHAQGSSSVVDNMPFAWRGHTKSLTTRAGPSPELAVWLE